MARPVLRLMILMLAALPWAAAEAGEVLDRLRATRTLTLAYRETSMPFSYQWPGGEPVGYSIDICRQLVRAIEKQLGLSLALRFVPVTSANRIEHIERGAADLECGSTTSNSERRQRVAFTIPTFIATTRLLVRADSGIREIWDTEGRTVVTTRGTTAAAMLHDFNDNRLLGARILEAPDHAAAFARLAAGEADAFLMDDVLLASLRARAEAPERFVITGKTLSIEPLSIMLPKTDPEFKALIDATVKQMILSGDIVALYRRWFESPIPPDKLNLALPMHFLLKDSFRAPTDWLPN